MQMAKSQNKNVPHNLDVPKHLNNYLKQHGLFPFGVFEFTADLYRSQEDEELGKCGILIGNVGSDMWDHFASSTEYADKNPDPMNRWTARVIDELAVSTNSRPLYPFDEPYWPFQKFARTVLNIQPSPLGILIHPVYGLWHAFRAVLLFNEPIEVVRTYVAQQEGNNGLKHPCEECTDKPCLSRCPVGAIDVNGLHPSVCFSHLETGRGPVCMKTGCEARNACPIGISNRYCDEQLQFHMRHYYKG